MHTHAHTHTQSFTVLSELMPLSLNMILFLHRPGYKKIVPDEGMPMSSDPAQKGDLTIEFNIEFPTSLTPERKDLVRTALLY